MFNFYKYRKSFYGFWQKYEIPKQLNEIKKLFYLLLVVWIAGSFITIINEYLLSPIKNRTIWDYLNFFFLNIKVILTTDFSDFEELTTITLIISILMVIAGIVVVGLLTGQIISALMLVIEKNKYIAEKPEKFHFQNPILICGINNKLYSILYELRNNTLSQKREIIIISEDSDTLLIDENNKEVFSDIYYIKGNPADRTVLANAINLKRNDKAGKPISAIILSENTEEKNNYSDYKAIENSLAIEAFDETVYTLVEITNEESKTYLERTKINEMINISEYGTKLMSQASLNPGLTNIYNMLFKSNNENDENNTSIYFSSIPKELENKSYKQIKDIIVQVSSTDLIFLGFEKNIKDEDLTNNDISKLLQNNRNKSSMLTINPRKKTDYMFNSIGIKITDEAVFLTEDTILNIKDKIIYLSDKGLELEKIIKRI